MAEDGESGTEPAEDMTALAAERRPGAVRAVYDEIATHFSETRHSPWPEVATFVDDRAGTGHAVGLDLGCGNGRHTLLLADVVDTVLGIDVSRALLREAADRLDGKQETGRQTQNSATGISLVQGEATSLPISAASVDVALYVATVHHLPDRAARIESLAELARVLAPDGVALVSAWSTAHDRFEGDADSEVGLDTTVDWTLPGGETVPRFYHIYAPAEFEADLRQAGLTIESMLVSSGNCYATVTLESG